MEQKELRELESRCVQELPPACTAACPVHVDVRAMLAEIGRGDFKAAAKVLKRTIPFPGIISRICDQPCRSVCRRNEAGDGLSVAALEKSCLDWAETVREKIPVLPAKGSRVAVVGAGLSGLTAAFDLGRKGYCVVVFEKSGHPGGSLWNVSEEDLPRDVILNDLRILQQVGVEIRLDTEVGKTIQFEELRGDFDALYLGCGEQPTGSFGLAFDGEGAVQVDPVTFATSREGVFAGGGMRRTAGRQSPIQSLADGRLAAVSIDRYLQKVSLTAARINEGSYPSRLYTRIEGTAPLPAVPMADRRGFSSDEAVREAQRCLQCQCLECVKVCEYLNAFRGYPKKLIREVYNNLSIVMGMRHANKLINSCSICGLCREVCPGDLHMGLVCGDARRALVDMGKMPPSAHDFPLRDMLFSNSEDCTLVRHQPGKSKSRYLFFPGCQLDASSPEHVKSAYLLLAEKLEGGVGLMLRCCGAPADWSGRAELFRTVLREFMAQWREMGRPQLITACSTCYEILKTHLAEVPVLSLWEVMDRLDVPGPRHPDSPGTVAIHDACTTRHEPHIHASVRNIVQRMGLTIEELPLGKEKTECCGYGGLMFFANPELAGKVIERRIGESPADYVAYCAMCRDYFASRGKRALHLLDLIFPSAMDGEDAATRKGPGLSQRHENRVHLRETLLKVLWGETVKEKEDYRRIKITIPADVREAMEKRLILEEDVQWVIDQAEKTGRRLLDNRNGRFLAYHKPRSVTYWVEYSPEESGFLIHNAYSHRMEIVEEIKT
ncbi:MAG: pyridine nucleotide-disulfide oxidoreductase/dicluster-binding protein [Syntrophobacter sp.]